MEFWFQTDVERLSTDVYSSTHNVCPYSIPHNAELWFCDKSGPQFWEQSGTYFWGPNLVPTSGGQIWYPLLGTKSGTHFWSPLCSKLYSILSAKLGTHFLAPNLVPTSGRQIWYPLLGTKSGTHFWCHVECIFLVQTLSIPGLAFVSATPACPPHFHPPRSHPPPAVLPSLVPRLARLQQDEPWYTVLTESQLGRPHGSCAGTSQRFGS